MATFTGTAADETITQQLVSSTVTRVPAGSLPGLGADTLDGGGGNDMLDGGKGADTMNGGSGDDVYFVDNVGDVATDTGGGVDKVFSSVTYTLSTNIENLTLGG